jgi:Uma2 family endonuclease
VVIYPSAMEPKDLKGPNVLLVVEIADSSRRYDMGRKAKLYASFGVRELWVIDAVKLTARVFREPGAGGYSETRDFPATERIVPLSAPQTFALRLDELRRTSARRDKGRANS